VGTNKSQWGALFAELGTNTAEAPPLRPKPLDQDGLLNLFSASETGADFVLTPATDADMRGKNVKEKVSLEVVYDEI
jgi:chlorophyllide a reductase subunit X